MADENQDFRQLGVGVGGWGGGGVEGMGRVKGEGGDLLVI